MVWEILLLCIWGLQPAACLIPDGGKGVAFFPLVFCAEDVFRMKISSLMKSWEEKWAFTDPGRQHWMERGQEAPMQGFLVTCASIIMPHLLSSVGMCPCKYISVSISADIPIGQEQVHVPKWGLTYMAFPPRQIESWPLRETKQYAFLPRTTADLQVVTLPSLAERGSRRRRRGQRVRLQFMKSDSGHALFQNPSRLLTPFSNICHVTLLGSIVTLWDP